MVARALVNNTQKVMPCRVLNPTDRQLKIAQFSTIGVAEPVNVCAIQKPKGPEQQSELTIVTLLFYIGTDDRVLDVRLINILFLHVLFVSSPHWPIYFIHIPLVSSRPVRVA